MSFYLGLKNTAQRLISKFGQSVSIARQINRATDPAPWQNSTDRPHLSYTYSAKAVTDNFQRSEIQFQNIEADDRLLYIAGPFVVTGQDASFAGEVRFEFAQVQDENYGAARAPTGIDWRDFGFLEGFAAQFSNAVDEFGVPVAPQGTGFEIGGFEYALELDFWYMWFTDLNLETGGIAPNCTVSIGPATGSTVTRPEAGDIVTVDGEALRLVQVERVSPGGTELLYIAQARRA